VNGRLSPVARVKVVLAIFLPALFLALPAVDSPFGVAATALSVGLAALAVVAALHVRLPATAPVHVWGVILRDRAWLTAFLRLRDPDAAGRTRSRAPSAAHAAA
jgi:Family of unknown function (DUF6412)